MTSLSRHVTGGIKATSRGFSGSRSRDRRKFIIFHLKDDNGKLWVEMIIVTSLDAMATVGCGRYRTHDHRSQDNRSSVGAARKVSPNWSQETVTCHSFNCFSIV